MTTAFDHSMARQAEHDRILGPKKIPKDCRTLGHNWFISSQSTTEAVEVQTCGRCGLLRTTTLWDDIEGGAIGIDIEDESYQLICIWCGKQCSDAEALDEHEDECAPS